jgi:hypothetical protein
MPQKIKREHDWSRKGTPNKITAITRDTFGDFLTRYFDSKTGFKKDWKQLSPRERVYAMIQMAKTVVPQPKSIDINVTQVNNISLQRSLAELALEDEE